MARQRSPRRCHIFHVHMPEGVQGGVGGTRDRFCSTWTKPRTSFADSGYSYGSRMTVQGWRPCVRRTGIGAAGYVRSGLMLGRQCCRTSADQCNMGHDIMYGRPSKAENLPDVRPITRENGERTVHSGWISVHQDCRGNMGSHLIVWSPCSTSDL